MREIYNSNCVLWSKTRVLAQDHGFEMSNLCPMQEVCNGETCVFIEPIKQTADNIGKFYERLEKHQSKVKLENLREELAKIPTAGELNHKKLTEYLNENPDSLNGCGRPRAG